MTGVGLAERVRRSRSASAELLPGVDTRMARALADEISCTRTPVLRFELFKVLSVFQFYSQFLINVLYPIYFFVGGATATYSRAVPKLVLMHLSQKHATNAT